MMVAIKFSRPFAISTKPASRTYKLAAKASQSTQYRENKQTPRASKSISIAGGLSILLTAYPALAADISADTLISSAPAALVGAAITSAAFLALNNNKNSGDATTDNQTPPTPVAAAAQPSSPSPPTNSNDSNNNSQQISLLTEKLKSTELEFTSKKRELESNIASLTKTIAEEESRRRDLESQLSQQTTRLQEAERIASTAQQELQTARREAATAIASANELDALLKKERQESHDNQDELIQGRKERESLKFKIIDAERRAVDAESVATIAKKERDDAMNQLHSLQSEIDRARMERNALETQLHQRDDQIEASYNDQNELLRRLEESLEDAQAAKSLVEQERQRNQTIEAARAAAVEDTRNLLAERRELSLSLEALKEEMEVLKKDLSEERMNRIAAEKALHSNEAQVEHLVAELSAAQEEAATLMEKHKEDRAKLLTMEEDAQLAAKDAKDALHREMEALAEAEKQTEAAEAMRHELAVAKREAAAAIAAAEAAEKSLAAYTASHGSGSSAVVDGEVQKKKRGRPKKNQTDSATTSSATATGSSASSAAASDMVVDVGGVLNEAEMSRRITIAEAAAEEAQQRAYEIRAEAALLVETVEDRAVEAVEAAQAEVKRLKAELKKFGHGDV